MKAAIDYFLRCINTFTACRVPPNKPGPKPTPTPSPTPRPSTSFPIGKYRIASGTNYLSYYKNIYSVIVQPQRKGLQTWEFQAAPSWQGYTNVYYVTATSRAGYFLANDDCGDLDGISCGPVSVQEAVQRGVTQVWILEGSYPYFKFKHPNQILGRDDPYLQAGAPNTRATFSYSGTTFKLRRIG
jgi:hypothetical protein